MAEFNLNAIIEADQEIAPIFQITDDELADWAIKKISEEKKELQRLELLAKAQIEEITAKIDKIKENFDKKTSFFTVCLAEYFDTVPHKSTKTQETYQLLTGRLIKKRGGVTVQRDEEKLTAWLKANNMQGLIKIKEEANWAELKKQVDLSSNEYAVLPDTGEMVDGITLIKKEDTFSIEIE